MTSQPVRCMIHGEEQLGLLSLNTATHPDHRYKKLFTRLASRTYEAAAKEGFKFVFGVANEKSIVGLVRYLEFQRVGQIDVEVGDTIRAGHPIGQVGSTGASTGPHVHVELRHGREHLDPANFLPGLR